MANAIAQCVRKVDLAARFGGDEFVIVLPEADVSGAISGAERSNLEGGKLKVENIQLSISLGVAAWNKTYTSPEIFIEAADRAMYQAKRSEDNRVRIADQEASD